LKTESDQIKLNFLELLTEYWVKLLLFLLLLYFKIVLFFFSILKFTPSVNNYLITNRSWMLHQYFTMKEIIFFLGKNTSENLIHTRSYFYSVEITYGINSIHNFQTNDICRKRRNRSIFIDDNAYLKLLHLLMTSSIFEL
jgi:hypothetical protein